MQVNWVYSRAGQAMTAVDVQHDVDNLYATGINHLNALTGPGGG